MKQYILTFQITNKTNVVKMWQALTGFNNHHPDYADFFHKISKKHKNKFFSDICVRMTQDQFFNYQARNTNLESFHIKFMSMVEIPLDTD